MIEKIAWMLIVIFVVTGIALGYCSLFDGIIDFIITNMMLAGYGIIMSGFETMRVLNVRKIFEISAAILGCIIAAICWQAGLINDIEVFLLMFGFFFGLALFD